MMFTEDQRAPHSPSLHLIIIRFSLPISESINENPGTVLCFLTMYCNSFFIFKMFSIWISQCLVSITARQCKSVNVLLFFHGNIKATKNQSRMALTTTEALVELFQIAFITCCFIEENTLNQIIVPLLTFDKHISFPQVYSRDCNNVLRNRVK